MFVPPASAKPVRPRVGAAFGPIAYAGLGITTEMQLAVRGLEKGWSGHPLVTTLPANFPVLVL